LTAFPEVRSPYGDIPLRQPHPRLAKLEYELSLATMASKFFARMEPRVAAPPLEYVTFLGFTIYEFARILEWCNTNNEHPDGSTLAPGMPYLAGLKYIVDNHSLRGTGVLPIPSLASIELAAVHWFAAIKSTDN
jgi:hypothetical protein